VSRELREIIAETKKQLEHLRVLGLEGIQVTAEPAIAKPVPTASVPAAQPTTSLFGEIAPAPVKLTPSTETFEQIHAEIGDCTRCPLHLERTHVVHTEGNRKARLMFVGEAPGADEDAQARPFVGRAGQLLTKILSAIDLPREAVYICNVLKHRLPSNRDPLPDEVEICTSNYLQHQIKIVDPSIIVTLGRFSMGLFFKGAKITQIHWQMQKVGDRFVIPMFHPAAALHNLSLKPEIMADFAKLPELLKEARAERGRSGAKVKEPKKKKISRTK